MSDVIPSAISEERRAAPPKVDLDELADTIRDSMFADDRQSKGTLNAGLEALAALLAECARLTHAQQRLDDLVERYYQAIDLPMDPDAPVELDVRALHRLRLDTLSYRMDNLGVEDVLGVARNVAARASSPSSESRT